MARNIFTRLFKSPIGNKFMPVSTQYRPQASSKLFTSYSSADYSVQGNALCSCELQMHKATQRPLIFNSPTLHSHPQPLMGRFNGGSLANGLTPCLSGAPEQRRFYQAALRPRLICPGCYFVWRHGRKHVECSDHPRHKQMKRVAKRKMWKEDYTSGDWVRALDFHKVHYRQAAQNVDRTSMSHNWLAGKLGTAL